MKQSKPREISIVVKFPDKSVKTFVVDLRKTVADITQEIGEKVGIKNPEEFSLQNERDNDESTNSEGLSSPSCLTLQFG